MTGTLWHLVSACFAFAGGHVLVSSTPLRETLVGVFGTRAYRGVYSVFAGLTLVWMVFAYVDAPAVALWAAVSGARHLALGVMVIASVLVVCALTTPNPTLIGLGKLAAGGPVGIVKVTRHPLLWGIGLWALCHVVAKGDAASLIFFGSLAVLALAGTVLIDRKKRVSWGAAWPPFAEATSNLPLAAIVAGRARVGLAEIGWGRLAGGLALYLVLLVGHDLVSGVPVLP